MGKLQSLLLFINAAGYKYYNQPVFKNEDLAQFWAQICSQNM